MKIEEKYILPITYKDNWEKVNNTSTFHIFGNTLKVEFFQLGYKRIQYYNRELMQHEGITINWDMEKRESKDYHYVTFH